MDRKERGAELILLLESESLWNSDIRNETGRFLIQNQSSDLPATTELTYLMTGGKMPDGRIAWTTQRLPLPPVSTLRGSIEALLYTITLRGPQWSVGRAFIITGSTMIEATSLLDQA